MSVSESFFCLKQLSYGPLVPRWYVMIFNVCNGFKYYKRLEILPEVMLRVQLFEFVMEGDFVILAWLIESAMTVL